MRSPRVGFLGGTFDPPHRGHVAIARAAAELFGLDRVLFTATGVQPLKLQVQTSSYADRLAMTRLVCALDDRFEASELDAPRQDGKPNYTVDTLSRWRDEAGPQALFVIVGADSFLDLGRWRDPERLLTLAEWLVVSRPGFAFEGKLAPLLRHAVDAGRVHLLDLVHDDISATELRRRLHAGEDCSAFLTEEVIAYIAAHGLYRG